MSGEDINLIREGAAALKEEAVEWFHKHIEDGVYSEALYELTGLIEADGWYYVTVAEDALTDRDKAEAAQELAEDKLVLYKQDVVEPLQDQLNKIEEQISELQTFISTNIEKVENHEKEK